MLTLFSDHLTHVSSNYGTNWWGLRMTPRCELDPAAALFTPHLISSRAPLIPCRLANHLSNSLPYCISGLIIRTYKQRLSLVSRSTASTAHGLQRAVTNLADGYRGFQTLPCHVWSADWRRRQPRRIACLHKGDDICSA